MHNVPELTNTFALSLLRLDNNERSNLLYQQVKTVVYCWDAPFLFDTTLPSVLESMFGYGILLCIFF